MRSSSETGSGAERAPEPSRALARSEERFRLLVDSVVDYAIFMLDPNGLVESWNAGAQRLKGYREDEIIGRHHSAFYPDDSREARLPDHLLTRAREQGHVEHTGWRVRKDGSLFWADVVITALHDQSGRLTGFAKVTRDRTEQHLLDETRNQVIEEQQRAVARLEELDRWRREFISAVAHDLQTPVTAIDGFARLLRDGHVPEQEREEVLEGIQSNARSLQDLIDNLRADAVLSRGQVTLASEPVDLSSFLSRLIADMAPLLEGRLVTVEVPDLTVVADRAALERVLRNLLSNVVRHTAATSPLRVRVSEGDGTVVVEVEDEGEGIPEELLPRIFDRYEGGDRGGTGLGLAIAKGFVELHGGTLEVDSTLGRGTTFAVTLPADGRTPTS